MGFPRHLVSLITGLYQDQKAAIKWNGDHCEYSDITKGVRQGCILYPNFFNHSWYIELPIHGIWNPYT
jgi:hypothetical protein